MWIKVRWLDWYLTNKVFNQRRFTSSSEKFLFTFKRLVYPEHVGIMGSF